MIVGEGGSIPVVGDFQRVLGAPVLLVGFGLPGENAHAPNEWMSDENFVKGMRAIAALWDELTDVNCKLLSPARFTLAVNSKQSRVMPVDSHQLTAHSKRCIAKRASRFRFRIERPASLCDLLSVSC